jgi:hypothetical protein
MGEQMFSFVSKAIKDPMALSAEMKRSREEAWEKAVRDYAAKGKAEGFVVVGEHYIGEYMAARGAAEPFVPRTSGSTFGRFSRSNVNKEVPAFEQAVGGVNNNVAVRKWYITEAGKIPSQVTAELPLQDQAFQTWVLRSNIKMKARAMMTDRAAAEALDRTDPIPSFEDIIRAKRANGLSGDTLWREIIEGSGRTRKSVNENLGLSEEPKQ